MDQRRSRAAWQTLHTQVARRRRVVVALLTGVAVVSGLSAVRPGAVATQQVWVAAHDLAGGQPISSSDVRVERLPTADVPAGALRGVTAVVGRLLAAPMRRGEPLTDVRILSTSLLAATDAPGDVAVPVRVADGPATLALVHAGDLIDVIAAPDADAGGPQTSFTAVHDVHVLATPTRDSTGDATSGDSAGLLIIEATSSQAAALAKASIGAVLSIAVRRAP